MFDYTVRRLLIAVPTLIVISLVIFLVLSLAPNDPMAQVPMTVPPEVKEKNARSSWSRSTTLYTILEVANPVFLDRTTGFNRLLFSIPISSIP
jgi:ABC-type dipeptide/oligopeptide/nickel transport system permease component